MNDNPLPGPPVGHIFDIYKENEIKKPLELTKHRDLGLFVGWERPDWVQAAIKERAPVNLPKTDTERHHMHHSPLHLATLGDSAEIIPVLIKEGKAKVDERSVMYPYFTPLQLAVASGKAKVVDSLLHHGADPSLEVCFGDPDSCIPECHFNSMQLAKQINNQEVVSVLQQYEVFQKQKEEVTNALWKCQPSLPDGVAWPTAAYLEGKIIVGSRSGSSSILAVYSIKSSQWALIPLYDKRQNMNCYTLTSFDNQVLVIGGRWRKGEQEVAYSNEVLSLTTDFVWEHYLPSLNVGRSNAASASFDGYVVVAGGKTTQKDGSPSVEVMYINNCHFGSSWCEVCSLPVGSSFMSAAITQDSLLLGFGYNTDDILYSAKLNDIAAAVNDVSKKSYSQSDFWKPLPKAKLERGGLTIVDNCMLAVGGCGEAKAHSNVCIFDCYKSCWSAVNNVGYSVIHPAFIAFVYSGKQKLYVVGGWKEGQKLKCFECCDMNT